MRRREYQSGFGTVGVLSIILVVAVLVAICLVIYQRHNKPSSIKTSAATSQTQQTRQQQSTTNTQPQTTPYQGWNAYNDTGYTASSGISIKYPAGWRIDIDHIKTLGNTTNPTAAIGMRGVFLPTAETPKDEWNTCTTNVSADACGAAPGDTTISSNESTINGYAAYTATMKNSSGKTYHVTVIRGNTATSDGIPFVEFTTTTSDQAALNTFAAIKASATFPN